MGMEANDSLSETLPTSESPAAFNSIAILGKHPKQKKHIHDFQKNILHYENQILSNVGK